MIGFRFFVPVRNVFLGATLLLASACPPEDDAEAECSNLTRSNTAALEEPQCTGSPRACSSFGVYTDESRSDCAYQDGCYPDYDSSSCRGTATPCSGLSEVYCGYQIGCTWEDDDSDMGSDERADSCGQQQQPTDGGSGPSTEEDAGGSSVPPDDAGGSSAPPADAGGGGGSGPPPS